MPLTDDQKETVLIRQKMRLLYLEIVIPNTKFQPQVRRVVFKFDLNLHSSIRYSNRIGCFSLYVFNLDARRGRRIAIEACEK